MTPSSDKNSPSDHQNKNDLLKAIGNPAATEEEWLSACEKLGDNRPPESRKHAPILIRRAAVVAAVFVTLVGGGVTLSSLNHSRPVTPQKEVTAPEHSAAVHDVDSGPYMPDLQRRIKRAWFPPKGSESKRVVVQFKVHADGAVENLKIDQSSGSLACDHAALQAVKDAAPLRQLPQGAPENVDIQFTFDYNVFNGGHNRPGRL
jgi:TonB family protein